MKKIVLILLAVIVCMPLFAQEPVTEAAFQNNGDMAGTVIKQQSFRHKGFVIRPEVSVGFFHCKSIEGDDWSYPLLTKANQDNKLSVELLPNVGYAFNSNIYLGISSGVGVLPLVKEAVYYTPVLFDARFYTSDSFLCMYIGVRFGRQFYWNSYTYHEEEDSYYSNGEFYATKDCDVKHKCADILMIDLGVEYKHSSLGITFAINEVEYYVSSKYYYDDNDLMRRLDNWGITLRYAYNINFGKKK